MPEFLRSRTAQTLAAVAGLLLFYFLGVLARQHSGVCIEIRNESREPVREVSVKAESQDGWHSLQNLGPGDHERVFLQAPEQSRIEVQFTEAEYKPRTITVFDHAKTGDCGTSTVRILPQRRTESVETHQSVSWGSWLDYL